MAENEKDTRVPSSKRTVDTAAALACRFRPRGTGFNQPLEPAKMTDESCKQWLKTCQAAIPVGRSGELARDALAHYYYAQTLHELGGNAWSAYRTAMFDRLQSSQEQDGSWPSSDGIGVGKVYSTALWCTILQLDKGSHPSRGLDVEFEVSTRVFQVPRDSRLAARPVAEPGA